MTYREAIRALIKAGVRYRNGSRHMVFYPANGGTLTVPSKSMTMSKKHQCVVDKVLAGRNPSKTSNRRQHGSN